MQLFSALQPDCFNEDLNDIWDKAAVYKLPYER
ncbi:hypothetical protein QE417_000977 [Mucilaginibacter terrae]|uniref:Uncharacterized protein n=1 Tax=Mucilaginibacter terrae TaxID=1955052 RepID=A0ABU3GQJ8_9SPHI|nr:hypothetical protein [Mucilaginibacter terrae]